MSSSSTKKRTLDDEGDDVDTNGDARPLIKKSRTDDDGNDGGSGDDVDQKLATLQRKAEEAEKKREAKKLKDEAVSHSTGTTNVSDVGDQGNSSAPSAQAGKPSTEEVWREDGKLIVLKSVGVKAGSKVIHIFRH